MGRFSVRDIFRNRNADDNTAPESEGGNSEPTDVTENTDLTDPWSDMPPESEGGPAYDPDPSPVNEGGLEDGVSDTGNPESAVMTPTYPSTLGEGTFSLPGSKTFRQYQEKRTSSPNRGASGIAGDDMLGKRLRGIR